MGLEELWFVLIAALWAMYFALEGFDFGVGILLGFLPRGERERTVMLETIGPVWDGNEVWLVVVGAATFAAFPIWYATMFSGFYLALLLVLVLLIVRAVGFEWRGKSDHPRWRATWRMLVVLASIGAPFVWGVALANLVNGVPLASDGSYAGDFADLFSPYTVAAGIDVVALFALHGATFLTLRTGGALGARAATAARRLAVPVAILVAAVLAWTVAVAVDRNDRDVFPPALPAAIGVAAIMLAAVLIWRRRSGWAFAMTAVATVALVATIFTGLYPRVLVSDPVFANSLTIESAASTHYTLTALTVVAALLLPVFILSQAWAYHVFRARLSAEEVRSPVRAFAQRAGPPPAE
jgi:cytochrome bd ubiquinol oxidase subunit II